MYLKSLVLKGFKSFVERTVITLEPGITVVVGPNGSGKSNISDAILWVLGEQSAKQLRGQVMEDVIFSGTSARPAVGVAEVDLVLDNTDGTLPLDFDEVAITRRMYRSGESEYLINGSPALLRDIMEILHDSGIGKDTHSIISQGSLSDILESRPEDRRALVEEAAGILKHKQRKERASRKIANMDAHLARVNDVAHEIDRQLRPLERQATRAKEHAVKEEELESLELTLAVDDLRSLQEVWRDADKNVRESDAEIEVYRIRYAEKDAELEKLQKALEQKGLFVGDLAEQRSRCQSILERLDSNMLLLEEKGKNMVSRVSEIRGKLHQNETKLISDQAEMNSLSRESDENSASFSVLTKENADLMRESEGIRKARVASDQEFSSLSADMRGKERAIGDTKARLEKARQTLASNKLSDDLLARRFQDIDEQFSSMQTMLSGRRAHLDEIVATLEKTKRESNLAKLDIDKRVRLLESHRKDLDAARDRHASIKAEIKGLEEVERAFKTASPALVWAITHADEFEGALRPVDEIFRVPNELEALVERLLGADLFGLVIEDPESAQLIAERLLQDTGGEGGVSLVPLDAGVVTRHPVPASGTRLLDSVDYDDTYAGAAEMLLGDVFVVDGIPAALAAHRADVAGLHTGARFVTAEGAVVWPSGKITLGMQNDDVEGVMARKRHLDELKDELADATAALADIEFTVSGAEEALKLAQEDDFGLSATIAKVSGDVDSAREEVGRLEQQMTALQTEHEEIRRKRDDLTQKRNSQEPLIGEYEKRIETLKAEVRSLQERIDAGSDERLARSQAEKDVLEKISNCKVGLATAQQRSIYLNQRLKTLSSEIAELKTTVETSRQTQASLDVLSRRVEPLHADFSALRESAKEWAVKLRDQAALEQSGSQTLKQTIEDAREAVRASKEELDAKIESVADVRVEKGRIEMQVEHAIKAITDHGVLLETALDLPSPEDRAASEERVLKLRRQIANIGPVNQVAMQEYESLKKRRDYIALQLDDLDAARKSLKKIVAAIDRKMRNQFLETYGEVDASFQEVFSELFPGGKAHLVLTDPENPDESGIDIVAQPAGKQIKRLMSMSGGEKSLTALALLFAVYHTRAVPFYVLDEVEAALDDTNLRRLVAYLDGLRHETQFIVISHQRRTMEIADMLYGVSMQGDGVSKVVSQKLERAIAENATDATPEDLQRAIDMERDIAKPAGPARAVSSKLPSAVKARRR